MILIWLLFMALKLAICTALSAAVIWAFNVFIPSIGVPVTWETSLAGGILLLVIVLVFES